MLRFQSRLPFPNNLARYKLSGLLSARLVIFWEISNRGHFSDSERFISTCKDLQEHGRHPKSLQDSLRRRYCVPRCVPRFSGNPAKLIDWLRRPSKLRVTSHKETLGG
jgi:hypothetical protein